MEITRLVPLRGVRTMTTAFAQHTDGDKTLLAVVKPLIRHHGVIAEKYLCGVGEIQSSLS